MDDDFLHEITLPFGNRLYPARHSLQGQAGDQKPSHQSATLLGRPKTITNYPRDSPFTILVLPDHYEFTNSIEFLFLPFLCQVEPMLSGFHGAVIIYQVYFHAAFYEFPSYPVAILATQISFHDVEHTLTG